jgi:hypothetical protein
MVRVVVQIMGKYVLQRKDMISYKDGGFNFIANMEGVKIKRPIQAKQIEISKI